MYTPEEINEIFQKYNEALANAGGDISKVSKDLTNEFKDAQKGIKNYTYQMNQSLKQLGSSITGIGKSLAAGEQGASVFNDSIKSAGDFIGKWASARGPWGIAGAMIVKGAATYVQAVNKQADALYKSYQEISRAGAIGAGGMSEVYDRLKQFGYGMKELDQLSSLLSENSQVLAKFGGTAFDGGRQLANLADDLQHSKLGERLMNMGMSVDEINKGAVAYVKQQTMLGQSQTTMNRNLANEASRYLENLEALSRLTGQSRQQQEERLRDAMNEQAFAYKMHQNEIALNKARETGNTAEEERLLKIKEKYIAINALADGEMRQEMIAGLAGDMSRMPKLIRTAPEALNKLMDDSASAAEVFDATLQGVVRTMDTMGPTASFGKFNEYSYKYNDLLEFRTKHEGKKTQEMIDQAVKESKAVDASTKNMTAMGISQRKSRDAMESFVNQGIEPVTKAMEILADVVEKLTTFIPGGAAAKKKYEEERKDKAAVQTRGSVLEKLSASGIKDKAAQANILAQIKAESGGEAKTENLNYTPEQLMKTFPKKFKDLADAQAVVAQGQEAIGNRVYGGRMGNAANEGFKYRGRGLIQLTGKDNYKKFGDLLGIDLVNNPDLANDPEVAKNIAVAYFREKEKQGVDLSDIHQVNRSVGFVGSDDYSSGGAGRKRVQMAQEIEKTLPGAALGGILSGPNSGFKAMLHGTEAVVPLPDGKTIPVEMPSMTADLAAQTSLMGQQLAKLDDLISVMRNQVSISQKILNYTQ